MSDEPKKKKIVIKKKKGGGGKAKPAIKLNKPSDEEETESTGASDTQAMSEDTKASGSKAADTATPDTAKKEASEQPEEQKEEAPEAKPKPSKTKAAKDEGPVESDAEPAPEADKPFKFFCVYCGQKLSASPSISGKVIKCPSCQHKIEVPNPPDAE